MTKYIAHHSATSIERLFQELPQIKEDQVVDRDFFKNLGYAGDTPTEHVALLLALGFIRENGCPSPVWKEYKNDDKQAILRRQIKLCYALLFRYYPAAYTQSAVTIQNWARANTDVSQSTSERIERTFRTLCKIAQFEQKDESQPRMFSENNNDPRTSRFITARIDVSALDDLDFMILFKKYVQ